MIHTTIQQIYSINPKSCPFPLKMVIFHILPINNCDSPAVQLVNDTFNTHIGELTFHSMTGPMDPDPLDALGPGWTAGGLSFNYQRDMADTQHSQDGENEV